MSSSQRLLRRIVFYCHLAVGCSVGVVVLLMSLTGVALAFERQIFSLASRSQRLSPPDSAATRLPMEEVIARSTASGVLTPASLVVYRESGLPIEFRYGPEKVLLVDPFTGKSLGASIPRLRAFFQGVLELHRWLGLAGERRNIGKAVTGACNLAFLFLVCSGIYLWWPRQWTRRNLRPVVLYRRRLDGRSRDVSWHMVTGFWCATPLLVIVSTGVVMSYSWANTLVYHLSGSEPPAPAGLASGRSSRDHGEAKGEPGDRVRGWNRAFASAQQLIPDWRTITAQLPRTASAPIVLSIDRGDGGRPDLRSELVVSRDGRIVRSTNFGDYSSGRRLRMWIRFSHTGEAGGLFGEAVAAVASTGAVFLACTGLALAIRRIDLWRRRNIQKSDEKALSLT